MAERAEAAASSAASGAFKCCVMIYELIVSACTLFGSCVKKCPAPVVSAMLRLLNLGNAVLLGAACYFAFQTLVGAGDVTRTFLAIYCGVFGVLLALVRWNRSARPALAQPPRPAGPLVLTPLPRPPRRTPAQFETRVAYTAPFIAKNCGFLFTAGGRTAFLIFLGAVCFGLLDGAANKSTIGYNMCLGAGIATFGNAFFNCFIICKCVPDGGTQRRAARARLALCLRGPCHVPSLPPSAATPSTRRSTSRPRRPRATTPAKCPRRT